MQSILANRFSTKTVRIYEAGGGSASWAPPAIRSGSHTTVVDIDETQLKNNNYANVKILGDIQTQEFPSGTFDLVICYNVIEHLDAPDKAIAQFYQALTPGGVLFIGAPNPGSFSGWVTKMTPHWFHVMYYRHVLGYKSAGQPGSVPFPAVFHRVINPPVLIEYCGSLGFKVVYFTEYKGMIYENMDQRSPFLGKILSMAVTVANALILWRKDLRNGDYHIVLEKPIGAAEAPQSAACGGYYGSTSGGIAVPGRS